MSPFHFNKVHSCARVLITKVKKKTFMFLIKKRKRLNVVYNLFDKLQRKSFFATIGKKPMMQTIVDPFHKVLL